MGKETATIVRQMQSVLALAVMSQRLCPVGLGTNNQAPALKGRGLVKYGGKQLESNQPESG